MNNLTFYDKNQNACWIDENRELVSNPVVEKLAAYESSGLTPEEVSRSHSELLLTQCYVRNVVQKLKPIQMPVSLPGEIMQALMNGDKTTIRIPAVFELGFSPHWTGYVSDGKRLYDGKNIPATKIMYRLNDILWVQERWCPNENVDSPNFGGFEYLSDYDGAFCRECILWHPASMMPLAAARVFLRVTGVRLEKLQDITPEDLVKEAFSADDIKGFAGYWNRLWTARESESYGWDQNPWVNVISFERESLDSLFRLSEAWGTHI